MGKLLNAVLRAFRIGRQADVLVFTNGHEGSRLAANPPEPDWRPRRLERFPRREIDYRARVSEVKGTSIV
jgi:radical SAM superfamily enzyme with C-terminal helix-hairpin-helix motif